MDRSIWIRRGRVALVAVGLGAALVGCYRPAEGRFPCETAAECPGGWYCRADELCWSTPGDASVGEDGGQRDASADAQADAGPDASIDAPAAPDTGSDAGPPECSTDTECPADIARCISGRCTFCVPTPSIVDIHSDPDIRDDIDMVVGEGTAGSEVAIAWRGSGTRLYLHRTPLEAPIAPAVVTSDTDAILSAGASITGVTDIVDVALGAFEYADGSVIDVALLARQGVAGTVLTSVLYSNDSAERFISRFGAPVRRTTPDALLGRLTIDAPISAITTGTIVVRSRVSDVTSVETYDATYLNALAPRADASDLTTATVSSESHAQHVVMADPADLTAVSLWAPDFERLTTLSTSDRTGEPSWKQLAPLRFLLTYPANRQIQVRAVDCTVSCSISSAARVDLDTGSDEVGWVRSAPLASGIVLLSAERHGARWSLILRVLRDDLRALTAPGGERASILDESATPDFAPIGRLETSHDLDGTPRIVASWINAPTSGDRTLRLVSLPLACE